mmetsp:Transcript_165475/g.530980  ORF Transcript_165475/g.530980 Transcript_165475/m.530980 type:complete len:305 (-) Transcript_165475:221-1135(-)
MAMKAVEPVPEKVAAAGHALLKAAFAFFATDDGQDERMPLSARAAKVAFGSCAGEEEATGKGGCLSQTTRSTASSFSTCAGSSVDISSSMFAGSSVDCSSVSLLEDSYDAEARSVLDRSARSLPGLEEEDDEERQDMLANQTQSEMEELGHQLTVLGEERGGLNRDYYDYLKVQAAESAAKGYAVTRGTRTVRKTRTRKTVNTTDVRTMRTNRQVEETTKVEVFYEEGAPAETGCGVMCSRTRTTWGQCADGTKQVLSTDCRGKTAFWSPGNADGACPTRTSSWVNSATRAEAVPWRATLALRG